MKLALSYVVAAVLFGTTFAAPQGYVSTFTIPARDSDNGGKFHVAETFSLTVLAVL